MPDTCAVGVSAGNWSCAGGKRLFYARKKVIIFHWFIGRRCREVGEKRPHIIYPPSRIPKTKKIELYPNLELYRGVSRSKLALFKPAPQLSLVPWLELYRNDPRFNLANSPTFLIHIANCRVHPLLISRPKSGGPWPFIPPARLELIRQHFSPLSFKGPSHKTRAARFALVGRFGFRHKSSRGRHYYPAGTPQNERGPELYLLASWLLGGAYSKKIIHPFFLLFKELTPGPRLVNLILAILTSYFGLINFIFPKT